MKTPILLLLSLLLLAPAAAAATSADKPLFTSLNHLSRECRDAEAMADFYTNLLGFSRVPSPPFPFTTIWLQHPSGVTMHLIEGSKDFRLAEGPMRDASTGERTSDKDAFKQGKFDPTHIRRGHHVAWNVQDLEAVKQKLEEVGIPYGESQVPGTDKLQLFAFDIEGNGLECVYTPPTKEEL